MWKKQSKISKLVVEYFASSRAVERGKWEKNKHTKTVLLFLNTIEFEFQRFEKINVQLYFVCFLITNNIRARSSSISEATNNTGCLQIVAGKS